MKKTLVIFVTLCLSTIVGAQSNYKQGYIITNQQDTIFGWINFRTDKINNKQCEFKPDLESVAKIYLPGDIAGYRFTDEGKYYVSREIQLNETPQKVFLEFLVKGIMNLYYLDEDDSSYYFFENPDGKMEIISQQPEKVEATGINQDGKKVVHKDMRYIGQVRYLFRDYQPIVQRADRLRFDKKSMMGVVEEYHNEVCTTGESCIVFQNEHPDYIGLKYKISAYTGLQLSNYAFSYLTDDWIAKTASQSVSNVSPVLGAQFNLMNPRWSESFSLQLDASLSQFKGNIPLYPSYSQFAIKEINYRINKSGEKIYTYDALAPSLRLGVKYTYPKNKISPTVETGIAYTHLIENQDILRHNFIGYYLAAGANYKIKTSQAIFVRLVYEDYSLIDVTQDHGTDKISMPHLKVGYIF